MADNPLHNLPFRSVTTALRSALSAAFFLFALALLAAQVSAESTEPVTDIQPLRPVDTSSPRATLGSFLTHANLVAELRHQGEVAGSERGTVAFRRALATLDLSATPGGNSWAVRIERLALLHEVLGRHEIPPESEIPGAREVADRAITRWTLPETTIAFERIPAGPRRGEFLFSADTVERIDRVYRRVEHLPYRPGATTGVYEDFVGPRRTAWGDFRVRDRLAPAETSSPRATYEGFVESVNRAYALVMQADSALRTKPPRMTKDEARDAEQRARNLLRRAEATLDLRQVPEALRQETGLEAVLLLKEMLDRMLPPPFDALPDEIMVAAAREGVSGPFLPAPGPLRWRLPNTEIEIVEIVDGDQQGQFLFSASSVARLRDSYERVRDLPYRPAELGTTALEYRSPAISPGFYEHYISTPGYVVPRIHFLGGFLKDLPDAYQTLYADQALWQWIGLLLCVVLAAGAAILVFRLLGRLAGRLPSPVNGWLLVAAPAVVAVFVRWAVNVIATDLNVTGDVLAAVTAIGSAVFAALVVWAVFRFCMAIAETLIASPRVEDVSIDASLVRVAARIVGFLVGAWVVVWSVRNLGLDVIPLLAGLGVGGLAVALAAQRTFANFIGSLILYVNRPVAVGDFCRYGDGQIGTVEEIGLLSTRIRSLERTIVTVPNADFSEMQLDNFARRDMRLFKTLLQLRYETSPEQLRFVLVKLRELLLGHPEVTPDPARVRFVELGEYSLDIEIFAYLRCQDQNTFLAIKEDLLLRIVDIVTEAGTSFAFPSAVEYRAPDKGVDVDRGRKAEAEVEQWRASGKLPFPEFETKERERLEDVLDYPPKGSPHRERS